MNQRRGGPAGSRDWQRWSWLCLGLLGCLAAASFGDAVQVNGRLRQAAALLIGRLGGSAAAPVSNPGYSAVLQRQSIEGVLSPEGLSYSASSRTLLTALENEQAIAELDLCGRLLRRIPVLAEHPLEEVTALSGDAILLSFANTNRISLLSLPRGSASLDASTGLQLDLRQGSTPVEPDEIAWDPASQTLYLASNDYPPRIYRSSFKLSEWRQRPPGIHPLQTREWLSADQVLAFMPDITALAYSEAGQELLLLSDETRQIMAVTEARQLRPYLNLEAGIAGLEEKIRSPEGLAIARDASLYLISDPAEVYLYRFYPELGLGRQSLCPGS
jgi:uncharacterized protein YjiK